MNLIFSQEPPHFSHMVRALCFSALTSLCVPFGLAGEVLPDRNEPAQPEGSNRTLSRDAAELNRFVLSAKFTNIIGGFDLFVPPTAGVSEFEIDFAKLPLERLTFSNDPKREGLKRKFGEIRIEPALRFDHIDRTNFSDSVYTRIFLSSESKTTRIQITTGPLKDGEKAYVYIYSEGPLGIDGMAAALGVLKEKPLDEHATKSGSEK